MINPLPGANRVKFLPFVLVHLEPLGLAEFLRLKILPRRKVPLPIILEFGLLLGFEKGRLYELIGTASLETFRLSERRLVSASSRRALANELAKRAGQ